MPSDISVSVQNVTAPKSFEFSAKSIAKIVVGALACLTVVGIPLGVGLIAHAVVESYRRAKDRFADASESSGSLASRDIKNVPDPRNLGLCHFNQSDEDLSSIASEDEDYIVVHQDAAEKIDAKRSRTPEGQRLGQYYPDTKPPRALSENDISPLKK